MIAKIKLKDAEAQLNEDGRWTGNDPDLVTLLNMQFAVEGWYASPSSGWFGRMAARDAVDALKAELVYLKPDPRWTPTWCTDA
jgi:hypothetical protein